MRRTAGIGKAMRAFAGRGMRVFVAVVMACGVLVPVQALAEPGSLEAASLGSVQTQAAGSISVTSKLTYDLYTGDPGTTKNITVKNTGSTTVSNVRLVRMTENKAATTKGNSRAVGYRWNDSGDISNSLGWLWLEKDYPCDTTDITLKPKESVTFPLRAYVDYYLAEGEWFPANTTIADTIQVRADGAATKTVTSTIKVTNPSSAPLSIGTFQESGWNLTKFGSINLGSIQAGTQYKDGAGYAFGVKNESSASTDNPIYRIVSARLVKANESDPDVFSLWGPGRPQLFGNADALSTAAFNLEADATFVPAGTYKATLVLGVSPGNMTVNGGKYSTIKVDKSACTISVPVQVKVTGVNPNLPAKVRNLTAAAGDGYVYLNWDKVGGSNDGYQIWRSDLGFDEPLATIYSANDTHFTDTSVTNGRTYTYYVSGYMQYSEKSDPASATPKAGSASRLAAPYLIDTDSEDHAMRLEWSLSDPRDRGDGLARVVEAWNSETEENDPVALGTNSHVSHFVVYMDGKAIACVSQAAVRDADGRWEDVELPGGSTASAYVPRYRWEGVVPVDVPGVEHRFTVAAVDADTGLEGYPSNALAGSADGDEPQVYDFVPIYTMLSDGVEFTFLSSYDYADAATYSVYRKKDGGAETLVKSGLKSSLEGTIYADRPAGNGTYVYRVKRVEGSDVQWSYPVTFVKKDYNLVMPPGAPTIVTDEEAEQFSRGGSHRVQLVWDPPETGGPVDHYVVYRTDYDDADIADLNLGFAGNIDVVAEVPASTTSYLDMDVWPRTDDSTVCYLVRAVNAAGESMNAAWTKIACEDGVDWADAAPGAPTITKLEIVKQWDGWWDDGKGAWVEGEADALRVKWAPGDGGEASEWEVQLRRPGDSDYSGGELYYDSSVRSHTFEPGNLRDSSTGESVNGTYSVRVVARNSLGEAGTAAMYARGEVDARPHAPNLEIPYRDPANYQPSIKLLVSPGDGDPWAGRVTSFKIWRSRSQDGEYEQVGSADAAGGDSPAVFFDTGFSTYATAMNNLAPGLYWYKVSAVNSKGEGDRSDAVCWYAYKTDDIAGAFQRSKRALTAFLRPRA